MPAMASVSAAQSKKLIRTCSIWRALDVIGDVPILLILESIWLGERRFDRIQSRACLPKVLVSNRLKRLVEVGILKKVVYSDKPLRHEYRFVQKGRDLFWVALMLLRWETRWSAKAKDVDVRLVHSACGHSLSPEPMCTHCRQVVEPRDVLWEEGPGVGLMAPHYARRRQHRNREALADNRSLFTDSAELLGDRWAGLIMRSVFTQLRRFEEILQDTAMASNILTERLNWLVDTGFLTTVLYQTSPDRHEYRLTRKGLDYYPVLLMLQVWGDTYYASPKGPPLLLRHRLCGHELSPYVGCQACRASLRLEDIRLSGAAVGESLLASDN